MKAKIVWGCWSHLEIIMHLKLNKDWRLDSLGFILWRFLFLLIHLFLIFHTSSCERDALSCQITQNLCLEFCNSQKLSFLLQQTTGKLAWICDTNSLRGRWPRRKTRLFSWMCQLTEIRMKGWFLRYYIACYIIECWLGWFFLAWYLIMSLVSHNFIFPCDSLEKHF